VTYYFFITKLDH